MKKGADVVVCSKVFDELGIFLVKHGTFFGKRYASRVYNGQVISHDFQNFYLAFVIFQRVHTSLSIQVLNRMLVLHGLASLLGNDATILVLLEIFFGQTAGSFLGTSVPYLAAAPNYSARLVGHLYFHLQKLFDTNFIQVIVSCIPGKNGI